MKEEKYSIKQTCKIINFPEAAIIAKTVVIRKQLFQVLKKLLKLKTIIN
ncbi:MAG: hypothetical protein V1773_00210 [bacterium]